MGNVMWSSALPESDGRIPLLKLQLRGLNHAMNNRLTKNLTTIFPLDIERGNEEYPNSIDGNTVAMRKLSTREARKAQLRTILDEALRVEHVSGTDDFQTDRHDTHTS